MQDSETIRAKEIALNASMRMNEPKTDCRSSSLNAAPLAPVPYNIKKVIEDAELIFQFITNL